MLKKAGQLIQTNLAKLSNNTKGKHTYIPQMMKDREANKNPGCIEMIMKNPE